MTCSIFSCLSFVSILILIFFYYFQCHLLFSCADFILMWFGMTILSLFLSFFHSLGEKRFAWIREAKFLSRNEEISFFIYDLNTFCSFLCYIVFLWGGENQFHFVRFLSWTFSAHLDLSFLWKIFQSASLCLTSTTPEQLAFALQWFINPLGCLGFPVGEVILTLLLSLRFISLVFDEVRLV